MAKMEELISDVAALAESFLAFIFDYNNPQTDLDLWYPTVGHGFQH
jgi:hypothetical protein